MVGFAIDDMLQEIIDQGNNLLPQPILRQNTVKRGVSFQHMQVGVHALFFVGILGAQAQVGNGLPFFGKGFQVTGTLSIVAFINQ
jgi:hypothetical protein